MRCALVNILTEASITEEDCNDSVSGYSIGAGRINFLSLLDLLLCHLFVSNFSVNRKGLFAPCLFVTGHYLPSNVSTQNQQQSLPLSLKTYLKLVSDLSGQDQL